MSIQFDSVESKAKQVFDNDQFVEDAVVVDESPKAKAQAMAIANGALDVTGDIAKTTVGVAAGILLADIVSSWF